MPSRKTYRGAQRRTDDHRHDDRNRDYDRHRTDRRRDRSRDRYDAPRDSRRERDRSPVRDKERKRSRDADRHGSDGRVRKRSRRDEGSPRRDGRDSKDGSVSIKMEEVCDYRHASDGRILLNKQSSRPSTSDSKNVVAKKDPEEEARLAMEAKLARVAAWKKKMFPSKADGGESPTTPASPLVKSESVDGAQPITAAASPPTADIPANPLSTKYGGKFDHKAISRRAAVALERNKGAALGGDFVIPKSTNQPPNGTTRFADNSKTSSMRRSDMPLSNQKISGFGLNKTWERSDKLNVPSRGAAAPMRDDEVSYRKLEKLPNMPSSYTEDAAFANVRDAQDDGDAINSEEEEEEKVREAAVRRAEQAQAKAQADSLLPEDVLAMHAAKDLRASQDAQMRDPNYDPDDLDALDIFMNDLEPEATNNRPNLAIGRNNQIQVFNNDDGEGDLDAMGDGVDDLLGALAVKKKKKEMPSVNHGMIKYEDFRKNFYAESVELADITPEEVEDLRIKMENIKCRGQDIPKPIAKWSQAAFPAQILDVIREQKFEKPTPIQSQALPTIMSGRDMIGIAKTGSGKTLAFLLPMFRHIKDQRPVENLEGPVGLILAPTRELVIQIHRDCKPYLKALNLRAVAVYGGAPIKDQIGELKRGADIIVATGGRLIDLLAANQGRVTNLRRVTYVVMDEADRMFDLGFEPQIMKILNNIRPNRQLVLFSATFPLKLEALARKVLAKPVEISVGGRSVVPPEITQVIEVREEKTKFKRLLELLGALHDKDEDSRSLIFVETQESTDRLLKEVMRKGYPILAVHGGRDQIDRDQAISDFKAGVAPIMVATSVAARGLDVKQLKLVVNYDAPNHREDYVHRCGRTGRAGNTGTAVTFVTPEQDQYAGYLIKALTESNVEIPAELQELQRIHEEKVKAGDAKRAGGGFGGRGIEHIEAIRASERAHERKSYKADNEPEEEEEEEKSEKEKKVDEMMAKATGTVQQAPEPKTDDGDLPAVLKAALSNAKKIQRAATPPAVTTNNPKDKVAAAAAAIANRLGKSGGTKAGVPMDNRGPDAGKFHSILEFNDFPQQARWAVTNRTNIAKVLESSGASITTKGLFYPPGKEPGQTEQPKLYVLVEGDTDVVVENAMGQLTKLLREGMIAEMEKGARAAPSTRYNVV